MQVIQLTTRKQICVMINPIEDSSLRTTNGNLVLVLKEKSEDQ